MMLILIVSSRTTLRMIMKIGIISGIKMMMMNMFCCLTLTLMMILTKPLAGRGSAIAPHQQSVKSNWPGLCIRASPASLPTGQAIALHPMNSSCCVLQLGQIVEPILLPGRCRPSNVKPIAKLPTNAANHQTREKPPLANAKAASSPDYNAIPRQTRQTANTTIDASKLIAIKNCDHLRCKPWQPLPSCSAIDQASSLTALPSFGPWLRQSCLLRCGPAAVRSGNIPVRRSGRCRRTSLKTKRRPMRRSSGRPAAITFHDHRPGKATADSWWAGALNGVLVRRLFAWPPNWLVPQVVGQLEGCLICLVVWPVGLAILMFVDPARLLPQLPPPPCEFRCRVVCRACLPAANPRRK